MGAEALGAYMAGVTVSGVMWAIFQNNAGGAWDNAKKSFEKGVEINGEMFYKKSEPHKAAVVGDTVGDPFKDTSGPSMNILIKLTCLVGLTLAPLLNDGHGAAEKMEKCHGHEMTMDCHGGGHGDCCGAEKSSCTHEGHTCTAADSLAGHCKSEGSCCKGESSKCEGMEKEGCEKKDCCKK
jgi:K(+)-stimulated pyrophosphate-energized sodium pump